MGGYGGDDTLHGESGGDFIGGGDGKDRLYGGDGNDVLNGQAGDYVPNGGAGVDTAYFSGGPVVAALLPAERRHASSRKTRPDLTTGAETLSAPDLLVTLQAGDFLLYGPPISVRQGVARAMSRIV